MKRYPHEAKAPQLPGSSSQTNLSVNSEKQRLKLNLILSDEANEQVRQITQSNYSQNNRNGGGSSSQIHNNNSNLTGESKLSNILHSKNDTKPTKASHKFKLQLAEDITNFDKLLNGDDQQPQSDTIITSTAPAQHTSTKSNGFVKTVVQQKPKMSYCTTTKSSSSSSPKQYQ